MGFHYRMGCVYHAFLSILNFQNSSRQLFQYCCLEQIANILQIKKDYFAREGDGGGDSFASVGLKIRQKLKKNQLLVLNQCLGLVGGQCSQISGWNWKRDNEVFELMLYMLCNLTCVQQQRKSLLESAMAKKAKQTINYVCKMDKQVFQDDPVNEFACECGKLYKTFPALYLHFQRSHKIKISTNIKDELCVYSKNGNVRTFTYYFSNKNLKFSERRENESFLYRLFDEFADSVQGDWDRYPTLFLCSRLHKYLVQHNIFGKQNFDVAMVSQIPNFFNDFLSKNQALKKSEEVFAYNCNILMQLARWLNFKGYSNLKLEYNEPGEAKTEYDMALVGQPQNSTGVL